MTPQWTDEKPSGLPGWYHHRRDVGSPIRLAWFDGHEIVHWQDTGLADGVETILGQWSERLVVTEEPLPGMADQDEEGS